MKLLKKKDIKKKFKEYRRDKEIVLVLENFQYARNVAATFRTADAAGVTKIYLTGASHTPPFGNDLVKASRNKENSVQWEYEKDTGKVIQTLKRNSFKIIAVDLTDEAIPIEELKEKILPEEKVALTFGNEAAGLKKTTLEKCDLSVFIPMYGRGASLNVSISVGIALYLI